MANPTTKEALLTAVSEADLFTLGRFPWRPAENPLWYMVGGNTFRHYSEHTPPIERFLAQSPK